MQVTVLEEGDRFVTVRAGEVLFWEVVQPGIVHQVPEPPDESDWVLGTPEVVPVESLGPE